LKRKIQKFLPVGAQRECFSRTSLWLSTGLPVMVGLHVGAESGSGSDILRNEDARRKKMRRVLYNDCYRRAL